MRYKPKSVAALHIALGGLPDKMRVEVDRGIRVSAKTVGELRKVTAWPENLVIITPQERRVCTENLILIDYVTESPNVNGDDRAALLLPDPVRLAVQVEEPT